VNVNLHAGVENTMLLD